MNRIMLIEDDMKLQKYIREYLSAYEYEVITIQDFNTVIEQVEKEKPNLILLDINLPKFDGFYYLSALRRKMYIPIIILSARSDESEQIRGMELGADDYVTKPFSVGILLAKINAVLRRTTFTTDRPVLAVSNIILHNESMKLEVAGQLTELSKNEYRLMRIFLSQAGSVVKREELLEALWDEFVFVDDNTLTVNITRLKKKLADLGLENVITTKRGVGYVFEPSNT
ncbi:response regulator transcription factor [Bacillus massiliigorillae]|uniref:response regulator transcription factor n=1 Tax=Bacillus massiliigorillae TaxID=1243664 RepID=UPI0003A75B57|nr:response regulator transcription factor [Bacillus massiliigorillae]